MSGIRSLRKGPYDVTSEDNDVKPPMRTPSEPSVVDGRYVPFPGSNVSNLLIEPVLLPASAQGLDQADLGILGGSLKKTKREDEGTMVKQNWTIMVQTHQ